MLIKKYTTGVVTQVFDTERAACINQFFTAGDAVEYLGPDGLPVDGSQLPYEPFNMLGTENGNIMVEVEGGVVQDVHNLPDGWTYVVDDRDDH